MDTRKDVHQEQVDITDPTAADPAPAAPATGAESAAVGYGRPPVHSRFKPGQSGNPLGRRKMNANISLALSNALDEQVSIRDSAGRQRVSKAEALLVSLVNRALQGDMKALTSFVKLGVRTGSIKPAPQPRKGGVLYMPPAFWKLSRPEQAREMEKEAARRDDLDARGLPYGKHAGPPMEPPMNRQRPQTK